MEQPNQKPTLEELFQPLGASIFRLENATVGLPYKKWYEQQMQNIGKVVDGYPSNSVRQIANLYLQRINTLKENLPLPTHYETTQWEYYLEDRGGCGEEYTVTLEYTKEQLDTMRKEYQSILNYFATHLTRMIQLRNEQSFATPSTMPQVLPEIRLPENFSVKQLTAHFTPLLSLKQTTLFLYFLREKGIMPNYNASELGKLAIAFFGRHDKNIREGLSEIHLLLQNSDDLKALEGILKALLEDISQAVKAAR